MNIIEQLSQMGNLIDAHSKEEKKVNELPFRYLGLYFTATWCSYCVKIVGRMPGLLASVNTRGSLFRLLTVRLDDDPSNFGYCDLRFKQLDNNQASEIAEWAGVVHIPKIIVYDYLGRLVTTHGYAEMAKFKENTIEMWDRKMGLQ